MAAAEPSRSAASPSPDSYIGSLISLTSKCEIRYEGILYNINTEESSIGLRNVRSFGTEGRKKDGPQIPASEKIYEYILFRGSDIKDLQVKSSPPVQPPSIHNDPAIIQSHYSHPASSSAPLPSVGNGAVIDPNSHTAQLGLARSPFQGGSPLYQPGGNLGSGSGLPMAMYYQGFYAPPVGLPHLQPSSLLRPPPGLPIHQSIHQPLQYPGVNASLQPGSSNLPEFPPPLFPLVSSTQSLTSTSLPSTVAPTQANLLAPETASTPMPNLPPVTSLPATTLGANLPLVPPLASSHDSLITNSQNMPSTIKSKPMTVPAPALGYQTVSPPIPSVVSSSTSNTFEPAVSLVTPDQLLQPGPTTMPSSQPLQTSNKGVVVKPQEAEKKSSVLESSLNVPGKAREAMPSVAKPSGRVPAEVKEPILPLPKPTHHKPNGALMHIHHFNRGRGRGRGNGYPRPLTKFTEEFDFMAMNEKFNKDEVWGHLGKSKYVTHDSEGGENDDDFDDNLEEEDAETDKPEIKPVYVKDDFFDTLSSNTLDRDSQGRRMKFSEQMKIDTETFGDFPRHRPHRGGGGRGFRGGGRARGSYYGRGYGYGNRGRGHSVPNRAS
ncbi:uncharacterized protein A4U43_C01F28260 [Asparagus officinalis]|uniref:DFDF domain-containing protein n=1 Tax=Asparagus officinalis TaxID=4686 RepID=A0A5P1FTN2_ASPOF|nr:protein decapping 5-like isoform X1 [Asparagus officinalis]XP_020251666.1 protein decapping 5-like isoform X2 [Asparagus officinalis]ONK81364.1 uncharacterized protein A4U43_C01F28260 [Asparagus officinalis]